MSHKTKILSQEVERVNPETGEVEIITTSKTWVQTVEPEQFFTLYLPVALKVLINCSHSSSYRLLSWLMCNADYENTVHMTQKLRESCMEDLKISQAYFYLSFRELLKTTFLDEEGQKQYILIQDKGDIIINPLLVWRGTKKSREKAKMQVSIQFKEVE